MNAKSNNSNSGPGSTGQTESEVVEHKDSNIVAEQIAVAAARWLADSHDGNYRWACRKAAAQLGVDNQHLWPNERQIQQALDQHISLFGSRYSQQDLTTLRGHALVVMRRLTSFEPVLFGALVDGTASAHSRISLCVFLDTVEEMLIHLINENIPFNVGEIDVRFSRRDTRTTPMVEFIAGDAEVRILILPPHQRQMPIDALSGKRYQRMTLKQLQQIVDVDEENNSST